MLKVFFILGTRPEAIKMAPVIQHMSRQHHKVVSKVCVTAQHRHMLDQVLNLFRIFPDYDLNIMHGGQTPTSITIEILRKIEPILQSERPDWVLVQGDTTTVMTVSLAAFYHDIKVGHVEAGLRTHDKHQPFPEEINRRLTGVVADCHFAPTENAADNLRREGVSPDQIFVTGNPVIDAIQQVGAMGFDPRESVLRDIPFGKKKIILVTAHRRENFGNKMEEICGALKLIAENSGDVHLAFPVHLNPNVWDPVHRMLGNISNITLTPPLDYLTLVHLMKSSYLVLTDSGGIQEEAPSLGVPVLVLRQVTERPEAVAAGTVRVVGTDRHRIIAEVEELLRDGRAYRKMARAVNPYGDGRASARIVAALLGEPVTPWRFLS
jgi:UDP-N-acetylglucosamine 2-epimerase (non-hydrolysing)